MIYIAGITQRCGTNYLADILRLHKECVFDSKIPEDRLISNLKHFQFSIYKLKSKWNKNWDNHNEIQQNLEKNIAKALTVSLGANSSKSVFRSPTIEGMPYLQKFYPNCKILVIIRDGRDVAVSYKNTWKSWTEIGAARYWKKQSTLLKGYLEDPQLIKNVLLIKYERLVKNTADEVKIINDFLGLDFTQFKIDELEKINIKGSSELETIHWEPTEIKDFNPIGRWKKLNFWKRFWLNFICQKELKYWGYI